MSTFFNWSQIVYNRYVDDDYDPTILDTYNIVKDGFQLEIIDTSGSGPESYNCLADQDICKAEAVLLFYSIASDSSFRKISDYYARVQSLARDPVVMLIGTKCDVDKREVPLEKGKCLAREMGVYFQEVSAKKGKNTERVLSDLKRLLFGRRPCPMLQVGRVSGVIRRLVRSYTRTLVQFGYTGRGSARQGQLDDGIGRTIRRFIFCMSISICLFLR